MAEPSLNMRLFGTEEPADEPRVLAAGDLTAELDAGNLRHIRYGGTEIMRAVSYIVRDRNWGTFIPAISDLAIEESGEGFLVTYTATVDDGGSVFRYRARIEGSPRKLVFSGVGEAESDFETNRTGFVVLHPLDGVAGRPVTIEHVDGSVEEGRFPELIDPLQPMMELRTLTHEPVPGLKVACRMEGDTFEMEDQRNWSDASYKTYVRPLALPWPYTIGGGERLEQSVTLTLEGEAKEGAAAGAACRIELGPADGAVPRIGVGLQPSEIAASLERIDLLTALRPGHVVYHCDPRAGGLEGLADAAEFARKIGAKPWLEAVIVEVEDFERELAALGRAVAGIGSPFEVVAVSPAADLKATLPGSPWPPAPPADRLYAAARQAFPGAKIAGGMFSFFTELNRKRPPLDDLDLVGFTTAAVVHAGDDKTVMESLEATPFIIASARAIAGDRPVTVGPSAIGMRMNPYGAAPMKNPDNIRQAMNENDPRQRGLMGAAWTLGYVATMAAGGAGAVTLGGTTGAHGVVAAPHDWPLPWYEGEGGVFPAFHVQRALSALAGRGLRAVTVSDPSAVQAVAAEEDGRTTLLVANLTGREQTVELPFEPSEAAVLDASGFVAAAGDPTYLDRPGRAGGRRLTLGAFAVARLAS